MEYHSPVIHPLIDHEDKEKNVEDPMQEQAAILVSAAEINAISMFVPIIEKFPFLEEANLERWDFSLTIAGVFVAVQRLNNQRLDTARDKSLMEIISKSLVKWDPDGIRAVEDCRSLFESECDHLAAAGHEPQFIASDLVGEWIVLNVLGRASESENEHMLVRAIGVMVTQAFFDWWEK